MWKNFIRKILSSSFFLFVFFLHGCAPQAENSTLTNVVNYYSPAVHQRLLPYFNRANASYPPQKITMLIFKKERRLDLWVYTNGKWDLIKTYPITAESGYLGPKLRAGDRQVPEGIYRISGFNPQSHYHLSLHLNYPDNYDWQHAQAEGRTSPGSNIFIHGDAKSIGCIAVGDKAIEELFVLVYQVGRDNVRVIIAPNDLRHAPPATNLAKEPKWVPQLYSMLGQALQQFA